MDPFRRRPRQLRLPAFVLESRPRGLGAWAIGSTYTGTVIGAGFVSGQEISRFFLRYGQYGFAGLAVAAILLGLAGATVLTQAYRRISPAPGRAGPAVPEPMYNLVTQLFGPFTGGMVDAMVLVLSVVVLVVMVAGGAATLSRVAGWPVPVAEWATALAAGLCVLGRTKWVTRLNAILIPVLATIITGRAVSLCGQEIPWHAVVPAPPQPAAVLATRAVMSGIAYAAFNFVLATGPLCHLGCRSESERAARWGAWAGGLLVGLLAGLEMMLMGARPAPAGTAIPLMHAIAPQAGIWHFLFGIALWAAILSTVTSLGWTLGESIQLPGARPGARAFLYVLVTPLLAPLGFASLVNIVYPILGILALPFLLLWLSLPLRHGRNTVS